MTEVQDRNREVLDALRIRRDRLYDAVLDLERALSVPAGDHPREWAADVGAVLTRLQHVLDTHVAETEEDGGFFDAVREDAPHLLHAVDVLRAEHGPLVESTAALVARAAATDTDTRVEEMRDEAVDLIRRVLRHRHRGAELVYDVYSVDISAAD